MSFSTREVSQHSAQPALLFHFYREGKAWYYTNAEQDIVLDGKTYLSTPSSIGVVVHSGEATATGAEITIPATAALAQYLDLVTPTHTISAVMRKLHMTLDELDGTYDAPVSLADAPVMWAGVLTGVGRPAPNTRVLQCNNLSVTMTRTGLRLGWQRTCPHVVYERGCFVDRVSYRTTIAALTVVNGVQVSAPEFAGQPDGYWKAGYVEWQIEAGVWERVTVEDHVGNLLTVFGTTQGMAGGSSFRAYPGCTRTSDVCQSRFANGDNFGGYRMHGKNPFDGNQVF